MPTEPRPDMAVAVDSPTAFREDAPDAWRRVSQPLVGLAAGAAAGLVAFVAAWLDVRAETHDLMAELGMQIDVPAEPALQFGMVGASVALLAWLVGATTRLRPWRAAGLVAGALLGWAVVAYVLFALDQFPAWPGFAEPFVVDGDGFAVRPTWPALAGVLVLLVTTAGSAWLGARGRGATRADDGARWGSALVGTATVLGCGLYLALQVAGWPSDSIGAWPASELLGWPFVGLALPIAVAWVGSGRARGVTALATLAALGLLLYASATTVVDPLLVVVGTPVVAIAAAHRPFARTLARLLQA